MEESKLPQWLGPKNTIDEVAFAQSFLYDRQVRYVEGSFFTPEGRVADPEVLRREIYEEIAPWVSQGLGYKVDRLLEAIRLEAGQKTLPLQEAVIHLANGAYHLTEGFLPQKTVCRHRLPVQYREDWPEPVLWLEFLHQLLEPEDIDTLQEYMGYCLVPVTYAQKMLLIIGSGGEGKSRIGVVMRALLGDAMAAGSLAKVELNPFARADLQHRLVMVDDDLRLEALPQTHHLKTIISAEGPMDLERKGKQSYQGRLYCRFLAFGNDTLQALHDGSHGFYRRQLILKARPRPADRIDDPYLGKRLAGERDAIFCWAVEGLNRLIGNDFRFTTSRQSRELMCRNMENGNAVAAFLRSEGYIRQDPAGSVSTRALYSRYRDWCEDNAAAPVSSRSFIRALEQQTQIPLTYTNHVPIGNGRQARGYKGLRLCTSF